MFHAVFRLCLPAVFAMTVVSTVVGCQSSSDTPVNSVVDGGEEQEGSGGNEGSAPDPGDGTTAARPNFLLIITDDQGLDASAQYSLSQDTPNTPNVDRLASEGIVFDNMWATPSCTTTRGSLLTGLHGVNSGVDTTPSLLDTDTLTVQKHLGDSGVYTSSVFGKWHVAGAGDSLPSHPNQSGVDHYAGNIAGTLDDYSNWPLTVNGVQQTSTEYHTTAVTNMAIDWIADQSGPWFTWVAYVAPHSPFHLPPAELHNRALSGSADDIANNPRQYYLAAIEAMDTEIGRLIDSIPADQRENTVVMVLGDNGTPRTVLDTDAFPRAHGKNSLYEGGIRVPFIVSGGLVSSSSVREAALVNTVDIFPTLSEAAGLSVPASIDGVSFLPLLSASGASPRQFNYSEFIGASVTGWVVRDADYKLIEFADGSREFYNLTNDLREENNLISQAAQFSQQITQFEGFAALVRDSDNSSTGGSENPSSESVDITGATLQNLSANCADYANSYTSRALDVNNNTAFGGSLQIELVNGNCNFSTNAIPNHDFNDGSLNFPNEVAEQSDLYTITASPVASVTTTPLSLTMDNAILLNGVKVDLLAAACFGVGNEKTGCGDPEQPWRFDPMFVANGFRVDSHNAHTQPDGTYHYHGVPNALFIDNATSASPVVGFAADGFPIYGSYFNVDGTVRKARSSYQLKNESRPDGDGNPGGVPDGTYRDDYEYIDGLGDLDECNGMTVNGTYGYYMIDEFPYILGCFKGTPDPSFFK